MKKFSVILIVFSILFTGCSDIGFTRYECQVYDNWDEAKCNPPVCYQNFVCTKDLFPQEFWDKLEMENEVPDWVSQNFKQYVVDQNLRYVNSLFENDVLLQEKLKEDANKLNYKLIPPLYIGGNKNEEQI